MGNHREFKGIIYDLSRVYNSRNNDFLGYWAIGQLCLIAEKKKVDELTLDLVTGGTIPKSRALSKICIKMKQHLDRQMEIRSIPRTWLNEAIFKINFNADYEKQFHYWRSAWGYPYTFELFLKTDTGKIHIEKRGGNCVPHNPLKERRRVEY